MIYLKKRRQASKIFGGGVVYYPEIAELQARSHASFFDGRFYGLQGMINLVGLAEAGKD
jgi:hypothetical protein